MLKILLVLLLTLAALRDVVSHAIYPCTTRCDVIIAVGQNIMVNQPAVQGTRRVRVYRGSTQLTSGATYVPGETLTVRLSATTGEWAFEATGGASFVGGGCTGAKRHSHTAADSNKDSSLVMPSSGTVTLVAGYATQMGVVSVTTYFTLNASGGGGTPSRTPTRKPRPEEMEENTSE
jgi:hypothetical protein